MSKQLVSNRSNQGRKLAGVWGAATITAVVLLLAAGSVASGSPPKHTGSKINIMQIIPPGNFGSGLPSDGSQAAVDDINAHGGVDGHPLNLELCYDGAPLSDPNDTAQCGRQAVADNVVALVGTFSFYTNALYPLTDPEKIPSISEILVGAEDYTNPEFFSLSAGAAAASTAEGMAAVQEGCKKAAFVAPQGYSISANQPGFAAGMKSGGGTTIAPVLLPTTQADFAPVVAQLESEGVDCIADGLASSLQPALFSAIHSSGVSLKVVGNTGTFDPAGVANLGPDANGLEFVGGAEPLSFKTRGEQKALADIKHYENVTPTSMPMELLLSSYTAVYAVDQALQKAISANLPLTGGSVTKMLDTLTDVGAGIFNINFAAPAPIPSVPRVKGYDWYVFKLKNGTLTARHATINSADVELKYHV